MDDQHPAGDKKIEVTKRSKSNKALNKKNNKRSAKKMITRQTSKQKSNEETANLVINVPRAYNQAMKTKDKNLWTVAIKSEPDSLEQNGTWKPVMKTEDMKTLNTKWVFKTTNNAQGGKERHKARMTACGNEQGFGEISCLHMRM
ncbi:retrotransposon ty1-copia subclass [Plasmopara halstedii]|uniref:Retrotransposon ty1-copia subclass n=1 Tax=Plasmopara halstedii TaxID=4781 RepID=A0A0P1B4E4_PLAHL|nr:retrotransposon ty1-copia subclass [Plasmopara halstedii]CEG48989.1 retrotransposon ty1-copia subclass [Plasmopara halstedii]|eukprot:XP_024585358.1 retrotransposon ty1-copia subclass [Plasmopara halstedii]